MDTNGIDILRNRDKRNDYVHEVRDMLTKFIETVNWDDFDEMIEKMENIHFATGLFCDVLTNIKYSGEA